jgi:hypothetical protein
MQAKHKQDDPSEELWEEILRQSLEDENGPEIGPAAQRHLDEGRPIYYSDDEYPGETVKHYPDGHREIVAYDKDYKQVFVRKIA